jgi:hypothetical protein
MVGREIKKPVIGVPASHDQQAVTQSMDPELVELPSAEAIADLRIITYRRWQQFNVILCRPSGESPIIIIDDEILNAINKQPFSSIQELVKLTSIPTMRLHRYFAK